MKLSKQNLNISNATSSVSPYPNISTDGTYTTICLLSLSTNLYALKQAVMLPSLVLTCRLSRISAPSLCSEIFIDVGLPMLKYTDMRREIAAKSYESPRVEEANFTGFIF